MEELLEFLTGIFNDLESADSLRTPLQCALFISPILLLGELRLSSSYFYTQQHSLLLVRPFTSCLIQSLSEFFSTLNVLETSGPKRLLALKRSYGLSYSKSPEGHKMFMKLPTTSSNRSHQHWTMSIQCCVAGLLSIRVSYPKLKFKGLLTHDLRGSPHAFGLVQNSRWDPFS